MFWPDPLGLALAASLNLVRSIDIAQVASARPGLIGAIAHLSHPTYRPQAREVSNWRLEALAGLDRPLDVAARLFAHSGRENVPRCVRLNNYWCIKKAGWNGEIAADAEGHVAFASAQDGAIIAARLLRRYYMDFGRHNAQAIVAHWAPAQCGAIAWRAAPRARHALPAAAPHRLASLGPAIAALARHELGNSLRMRSHAAHALVLRRTERPKSALTHRSFAHENRPGPRIAAIMAGEKDISLAPVSAASLGSYEVSLSAPMQPDASCAGESLRIRNYALRAIAGIAQRPDEDLNLFAADGTPSPNLPALMINMAKVEIGPLAARPELVAAAIAKAFIHENPDVAAASRPAP
jgi:hypothetical protein